MHCNTATVCDKTVVTFDVDLMDSTVLACALAAYCPFLVSHSIQEKKKLKKGITFAYIHVQLVY